MPRWHSKRVFGYFSSSITNLSRLIFFFDFAAKQFEFKNDVWWWFFGILESSLSLSISTCVKLVSKIFHFISYISHTTQSISTTRLEALFYWNHSHSQRECARTENDFEWRPHEARMYKWSMLLLNSLRYQVNWTATTNVIIVKYRKYEDKEKRRAREMNESTHLSTFLH